LRGPFSEQNPTLARTPASPSAIACNSTQDNRGGRRMASGR
jgi:hypothetical protein